ncbi:hypothetical protein ABGB12_02395 [Actinocorallia sp. B10E7]|uniref:hypothetical protein n=1 Tax=Actinocorallia sp. B10E7 TaxID=3153558 RepID=UPI00325DA8F7
MTDEQPVFVDGTGKRRKLFQVAGVILGVIIAGYAIALGVSLGTGAAVPLTTWVVPEKNKKMAEQKAKFRPKSVVPTAVPQPSVPVYIPPTVTPSVTVAPTEKPTKTATARPTVIIKTPKPTKTTTPEPTTPPSPDATPTVTAVPSDATDPGNQPTVPPGQEKKIVEE